MNNEVSTEDPDQRGQRVAWHRLMVTAGGGGCQQKAGLRRVQWRQAARYAQNMQAGVNAVVGGGGNVCRCACVVCGVKRRVCPSVMVQRRAYVRPERRN